MRDGSARTPTLAQLLIAAAALFCASFVLGSEPSNTPSPAARPAGLVPDRFTAADFSALTDARAARMAGVFPRLTAFLVSRRVEVEAAQAKAARRSMPAVRSAAIAALEAWLSVGQSPEALAQATTYLTAPPQELLRDAALMLSAREEQKLQEAAAEIRKETESSHAELKALAADPKLTPQERAQLEAQLTDLSKAEADLSTTGQPVPPEAVALAAKHHEAIDGWTKWAWPKP